MVEEHDAGATLLHRQRLVWKASLVCPPRSGPIEAVAALTLTHARPYAPVTLPDGGRLHLLKHVRMDSIPPVLLTAAVFGLYINAHTPDSQRYINGMVEMLLPQPSGEIASADLAATAILARVETRIATDLSSSPAALIDPFAESPDNGGAEISPLSRLRNDPYALVYLSRSVDGSSMGHTSQHHLVLHLLECPQSLQLLSSVAIHHTHHDSHPYAKEKEEEPLSTQLETEYRFIELLTSQRNERTRIQRTQSTESMMKVSSVNLLTRQGAASNIAGNRRISKKMTLSDIEHMALSQTSNTPSSSLTRPPRPPEEVSPQPCPEIEQKNKKIAKQLIISSLKERGVGRDHPDFAALWGQIYHSLKFALRDKIDRRLFPPRELKQESDKHANFYCTPL
ncbi:hypothetical protein GGI08_004100 [Coemansia sp. S2]|nr:hypothetical protein GGI14_000396 [Coemansia sp. S680]KAJ2055551.1 hypothetical protein GGI08_004100 [Coemansia sp. S2]KAJ2340885.1 hypothetical protein GGH92_006060 [Coemansia sp. RSA 2673]